MARNPKVDIGISPLPVEVGDDKGVNYFLCAVENNPVTSLALQVDRIAYDNGGSLGGGGGVSSLEAEVLQLRRELAASKIELAEASCNSVLSVHKLPRCCMLR